MGFQWFSYDLLVKISDFFNRSHQRGGSRNAIGAGDELDEC
jgi:hypothetical protein